MLEHFAYGRVHHVVPSIVLDQSVDYGRKKVSFDDVSVVELVL